MATGNGNSNGAIDKTAFKGVFPANPTPVHEDGRINEKALRAILEDNMSHGVQGFWIAGSTGEGPVFNDEQRTTIARIAGETTRGKALAIMHVGAVSTESAAKAARAAKESGCAAVCCVPPFFFRPSRQSILDHYRAVAEAADGLPFFVYNLPQLTQTEFTPALMEDVMENVPNVTGLKHSAPVFHNIRAFADMGLRCFNGNGMLALPALTMGACGTVDAPLSIAPWAYTDMFAAWESGDFDRAQQRQNEVARYVEIVRMFGAPAHVTKLILSERLGVDCGKPVPPVAHLDEAQKAAVMDAARDAGLLEARSPAASR